MKIEYSSPYLGMANGMSRCVYHKVINGANVFFSKMYRVKRDGSVDWRWGMFVMSTSKVFFKPNSDDEVPDWQLLWGGNSVYNNKKFISVLPLTRSGEKHLMDGAEKVWDNKLINDLHGSLIGEAVTHGGLLRRRTYLFAPLLPGISINNRLFLPPTFVSLMEVIDKRRIWNLQPRQLPIRSARIYIHNTHDWDHSTKIMDGHWTDTFSGTLDRVSDKANEVYNAMMLNVSGDTPMFPTGDGGLYDPDIKLRILSSQHGRQNSRRKGLTSYARIVMSDEKISLSQRYRGELSRTNGAIHGIYDFYIERALSCLLRDSSMFLKADVWRDYHISNIKYGFNITLDGRML